MPLRRAVFACPAKDLILGDRIELAESLGARTRGLLGRARLRPGEGMLLRDCAAIHQWFMIFPIDVVFVDRDLVVRRIARAVPPFWFAFGGRGAVHTLELPARHPAVDQLAPGDRLTCRLVDA